MNRTANRLTQSLSRFSSLDREELELFSQIIQDQGRYRKDIIGRSPWGTSKTGRILRNLQAKGLVKVIKEASRSKGRNRYAYTHSPDLGFFLGVELSPIYDRIVLTDFVGQPLIKQEFPASYSQNDIVDSVQRHITEFFEKAAVQVSRVYGMGFGLHGIFDEETGIIHRILYRNENVELDIKSSIQDRFGVQVSVGHPKVLVLFKEAGLNLIQRGRFFINVNIGYGIGMGIFLNGIPYHGISGMAGEFGHFIVPSCVNPCYCGNRGCLRTLISYQAICEEARSRIQQGYASSIDLKKIQGPTYEEGVEHIIGMAIAKDKLSFNLLNEVATHLGTALASAITLLNPELIVIHSNLILAGDLFTVPVRIAIQGNTLQNSIDPLRIEFLPLDPFDVATGGAVLALKKVAENLLAQKDQR